MKKVIGFSKFVLSHPIIILGLVYVHWFIFVPITRAFWQGLVLLAIYFSIVRITKLLSSRKILSFLFLILLFPIALYSSVFVIIFVGDHISISRFDNEFLLFVIGTIFLTAYPVNQFVKNFSLEEEGIIQQLFFLVTLPILVVNFLYLVTYRPEIIQRADVGKFHYLITSERDGDFHPYSSFYKCEKWSVGCDYICGSYSWPIAQIIYDDERKEASLLSNYSGDNERMICTDGEEPRIYQNTRAKLENHRYFLSWECNNLGRSTCDSETYTLYKCDLEYKSCDPLPVQYTDENYNILMLKSNEETNEIELYDDFVEDGGNLIFTYGENPQCYVEGCEILEE